MSVSRQREVGSIADPLEVIAGLGDDPALELLNTLAEPAPGMQVELIGDGAGFTRWLHHVGLVDDDDRLAVQDAFGPDALDDLAATARELREHLRAALVAWIDDSSSPIASGVVERLNAVMAGGTRFAQLHPGEDGGLQMREHRRWTDPLQLLVPVAEAWARLLTTGDPALIHRCPGCTIVFYDRTKAHTRRWCSMALCGNRAKARRHRANTASAKDSNTPKDSGTASDIA